MDPHNNVRDGDLDRMPTMDAMNSSVRSQANFDPNPHSNSQGYPHEDTQVNSHSNSATNLVMGLDIGSAKICASICEVEPGGELNLLGVGTSISSGLRRGKIVDSEDLYRSIERAINRAERQCGVRPSKVVSNVPIIGMQFVHNTGFFLSKSETGQITESEKMECLRRSKNIAKPSHQTVMHVIPLFYKVDGAIVKDPVGAFGTHLEVSTVIVLGDSENIMALKNVLKDLSMQISGFVYDSLAASQVMLPASERKNGIIFSPLPGQ